jgi:UDP-3-O-[3-hydroxymyristoyl] glucosamine N-acyltransferase
LPAGLTAQAVAELVGGRLLGDGAVVVRHVRSLDSADSESLSLAVSSRYADELRASRAGVVLVPEALAEMEAGPRTRVVVREPYAALLPVLRALYPAPAPAPGIDSTARIGAGVVLGDDVSIGPFVVIGAGARVGDRCRLGERVSVGDGTTIGDDAVLEPGVVCYAGSTIGRRVVIKANAVIGGGGFGFVSDRAGHTLIPHVGGCIIGDDVQIGSNACVDRGSLADTVIGPGTKIDNLVHVAHNVRIGARCLMMAGAGVGGSTHLGDDVVIAGHAGIIDNIEIGNGARIGAKSGVFGHVPAGAAFSGHPARPHRQVLRAHGALFRLSAIVDELERLVGK